MLNCTLKQSGVFQLVFDGKPIVGGDLLCGCNKSGDHNCITTILTGAAPKFEELFEQGQLVRSDESGLITVSQEDWGKVIPALYEAWKKPKPGSAPNARPQRSNM